MELNWNNNQIQALSMNVFENIILVLIYKATVFIAETTPKCLTEMVTIPNKPHITVKGL